MSGRFCSAARSVFFIAQAQVFQPVPQGGDSKAHFQVPRNAPLELGQSQIRLLPDPSAQGLIMLFQTGTPAAAPLLGIQMARAQILLPITLHTALGNLEQAGGLLRAVSALPARDDALAQISAAGSHPIPPSQIASDSIENALVARGFFSAKPLRRGTACV